MLDTLWQTMQNAYHQRFCSRPSDPARWYKDECARCRGAKGMTQIVDHTPTLTYVIAATWNLRVRRLTKREWVKCWLCKGTGVQMRQTGM